MVENADDFPSFETLDAFRPRTWAIIHGSLLSLLLFFMSVFAIRYSWIHVLNLRFPEVVVNTTQPSNGNSAKLSEYRQLDVIPTETADPRSKTIASTSPRPGVVAAVPAAPVPTRGVTIWLEPYVGKYVSINPPAKIWIQVENDPLKGDRLALSLAAGSHSGLALSPVSPTRFAITGVGDGYVNFTADAQGRIGWLTLVVGGKAIAAQRQ
ncbi:MAG: hypothetical protein ACLQLC_01780 [Candidatus Sulfotelmatobacter sp.]